MHLRPGDRSLESSSVCAQVVALLRHYEDYWDLNAGMDRFLVPWEFDNAARRDLGFPEPCKNHAARWWWEDFGSVDAQDWFAVGLAPDDLAFAKELRGARVPPHRANDPLRDPTTGQSTTVLAFAYRALTHYSSLGSALDDAGYVE